MSAIESNDCDGPEEFHERPLWLRFMMRATQRRTGNSDSQAGLTEVTGGNSVELLFSIDFASNLYLVGSSPQPIVYWLVDPGAPAHFSLPKSTIISGGQCALETCSGLFCQEREI